jgi:hypothetical protein
MKFRKIVLQTNQLDVLSNFYSSVLELSVKHDHEKKIFFQVGRTELEFQEVKTIVPFYHFAINIPCNKLDEARLWLKSRVELLWMNDYNSDIANFKGWNAKSVYFFDPAGNIVELISRFELNDPVDEKFASKHFNSISEVGIVFKAEEFDTRTDDLLQKFHLQYFSKQPPLQQFRAIGDDEGLFIIVPEDRNWYPTDRPAGIFPMEVNFEEKGKNFTLQM